MRITHREYNEFVARFYCSANSSAKHCVPIEIETASGDLAATAYVSDEVFLRAADWLKLFRTANEMSEFVHPTHTPPQTATDIPVRAVLPSEARVSVKIAPSLRPTAMPQTAVLSAEAVSAGFEAFRRDCPKCARRIMRAATQCGYCWAKLDAVADLPGAFRIDEGPAYTELLAVSEARRPCPRCGKQIMPDATRCGFCWVSVVPL